MSHDSLSNELAALLENLCLAELSQAQAAQLEVHLAANPEQCRHYVRFVQMHAIAERCEGTSPACDDSRIALPHPPAEVSVAPSQLPTVRSSPVRGFQGRSTAAMSRPIVWSTLAAGVLFVGYVVAISWNILGQSSRHGGYPLGGAVAQVPGDSDDSEYVHKGADGIGTMPATNTVATIRNTADAKWSPTSPLAPDKAPKGYPGAGSEGAAITSGQPLALTSGIVELQLKQGTTLVVEAPAEWTIDGENQATLSSGKLVANVPQQAIGFVLRTPTATIVDLGTEFGVEVNRKGESDIQVLKGRIDIRNLAGKEDAALGLLATGHGVKLDSRGKRTAVQSVDGSAFKHLAERIARRTSVKQASMTLQVDLTHARVSQSSDYAVTDYPACFAIDKDLETFTHTSLDDALPHLLIDLGTSHKIGVVVLHNRADLPRGRFRDITVSILAEDGRTEVARSPLLNPANSLGGGAEDTLYGPAQLIYDIAALKAEPAIGRFVRVERTPCTICKGLDNQRVLSIGEIEVFEAVQSR